jgi:hypothetical protein
MNNEEDTPSSFLLSSTYLALLGSKLYLPELPKAVFSFLGFETSRGSPFNSALNYLS